MNYDVRTTRQAAVTFVSVIVENTTDRQRRVRVRNALDGPVWPPRTNGVPDRGWTARGYVGVLDGSERRALGYATGVPPAEPVVTVSATDAARTDAAATVDPVRELPDPRPPADALVRPRRDGPAAWLDDGEDRTRASAAERTSVERGGRLAERS